MTVVVGVIDGTPVGVSVTVAVSVMVGSWSCEAWAARTLPLTDTPNKAMNASKKRNKELDTTNNR